MRAYLGAPRCRAAVLSQYLDQVAWHCEDPAARCDRCLELGLQPSRGGPQGETASVAAEQEGVVEEDVEEEEETDGSSESSSDADDLEVGAGLLRQHVRDEGSGLQRYIEGLER